jgi:hypothetical protein
MRSDSKLTKEATSRIYRPDEPRATPFLFVPLNSVDRGNSPRVKWLENPSVLFLSEKGILEFAPSCGISYRMVVLVGNSGNSPSWNTFAEFCLGVMPGSQSDGFGRAVLPSTYPLGVSAFSVDSYPNNQGIGWAISPKSWTPRNSFDLGLCAGVRVLDPIHDSGPVEKKGWQDRHVGSRLLGANYTGVWSGDEVKGTPTNPTGEVFGKVTVKLYRGWTLREWPDGIISNFEGNLIVHALPSRRTRINFPIKSVLRGSTGSDQLMIEFTPQPDHSHELPTLWSFVFSFADSSGRLLLEIKSHGQPDSFAWLSLTSPQPTPPAPDAVLLRRVRRAASSTWSPRRKADEDLLLNAIAALPT